MNKKLLLKISLGLFAAGTVYLIGNKMYKKSLYKKVKDKINEGLKSGDIADYASDKAFDSSYYKNATGAVLIPQTNANNYAIQMRATKGSVSDNEQGLITLFAKLKNKAQVSQVADAFQTKYGEPLYSFTASVLDNKFVGFNFQTKDYMSELTNYIKNLPLK